MHRYSNVAKENPASVQTPCFNFSERLASIRPPVNGQAPYLHSLSQTRIAKLSDVDLIPMRACVAISREAWPDWD